MKIRWRRRNKKVELKKVDPKKGDSTRLFAETMAQSDCAWDRMHRMLDEEYVWPKYGKPGFWRGGGL